MVKLTTLLLTTGALALGLAACGSSSSNSSTTTPPPASTSTTTPSQSSTVPKGALKLAANSSGELHYDTKTLSAKAGKVTIAFTNVSPLMHNVTIQQGTNGKILGATPTFQGATKILTLNLKPGTYTYFCSVPGHRMAGMVGTLTVH